MENRKQPNQRPIDGYPKTGNSTQSSQARPVSGATKGSKKNFKKVAFVVLAVLLLLALAYALMNLLGGNQPRSDRYQAVFLDNNQVFFGKLKNTNGEYLTLENAYYTKSQDLPEDATEDQEAATSSNVSLVKVGSEVYGPEDTLKIRAEQVLFWQDLTTESKVTKAIDSAKE